MDGIPIRVPERGSADVPRAAWTALAAADSFWRLVDRGVISVSSPSRGRFRLHGSCYVGRAHLGETVLEVHEKVEGALRALLSFATGNAFRLERLPSPASELGPLLTLLVHQFLEEVTTYVSAGRECHYSRRHEVGSLVGGRIDTTLTAQLWARGLRHLISFERNVLTYDTPTNRVVLTALREVERLARVLAMPTTDTVRARTLTMLFSDCRDARTLFCERGELARMAQDTVRAYASARTRDLLSLAGVILAHESFEHMAAPSGTVPRAWFLNLENVFELAVRTVLQDLCGDGYTVEPGGRFVRPIFERASSEFRARPDIVIRAFDGFAAVGDVKYKEWTGRAAADDLYQLLVHAAAFGSPLCFLIYPGDAFDMRFLGKSATGVETWLLAPEVGRLAEDLEKGVAAMGLAKRRVGQATG